jgi:Domain of unknown function (DUF5666)
MNSKKKTITAKCGTPRRILITLLVALFVMSLPGTSGAQTLSLTGKVVGIDKHKQILTVDGSYFYAPNRGSDYGGAAGISTFALGKRAYVMKGSQKMDFDDIRVGDWVTVNFHQEGTGIVIADGIAFTSPPAPYTEERGRTFSFSGKVVGFDRGANTLVVDPSYYYGPNYVGTRRTFVLDSGTWVLIDAEKGPLERIKVGDWVTVNFHWDSSGLAVAEGITVIYPPAPYPVSRAAVTIQPPPELVIAEEPDVIVIPGTDVYYIPDIEANIVFYDGNWYREYGRHWFVSASYNGPWVYVENPPDVIVTVRSERHPERRIHLEELKAKWREWKMEHHWQHKEE